MDSLQLLGWSAVVIFALGLLGVVIRRNVLVMLMCMELMLNAVNLSLVVFAQRGNPAEASVLVFLVFVVAAAGNAVIPAARAEEAPPRHMTRGGWVIQVGAFEDESEAKERLASAQSKAARLLSKAECTWVDAYHARVAKEIAPLVDADTRAWLAAATRPLESS